MDRGLLGIRKMDRVPNARIRELCGVTMGEDETIHEVFLRWLGHVERMEDDRIAKRIYEGECTGSRSVSRPQKRWIGTVKDCLRKRGLGVRQARRMVQDRRECKGRSPGDEPLNLTRYHSCGLSQLYEAFGWKSICGRA